jgi:hypothetical protein
MTLPGDAYAIEFDLPPGTHEVFLESRGYYYEWIRREWLADENPAEVVRFLLDPRAALRRLAPAFGEVEAEMDRRFWGSRFGTPRRMVPR